MWFGNKGNDNDVAKCGLGEVVQLKKIGCVGRTGFAHKGDIGESKGSRINAVKPTCPKAWTGASGIVRHRRSIVAYAIANTHDILAVMAILIATATINPRGAVDNMQQPVAFGKHGDSLEVAAVDGAA